jgi:hypothetical protein
MRIHEETIAKCNDSFIRKQGFTAMHSISTPLHNKTSPPIQYNMATMRNSKAAILLLILANVIIIQASTGPANAFFGSSPSNLRGNRDHVSTKAFGIGTTDTTHDGLRLRGTVEFFDNEVQFAMEQIQDTKAMKATANESDKTTVVTTDDGENDSNVDNESMVLTSYNDPEIYETALPTSDTVSSTDTNALRILKKTENPKSGFDQNLAAPQLLPNYIFVDKADFSHPTIPARETEAPILPTIQEPDIAFDRDANPYITEILLPEAPAPSVVHEPDDITVDRDSIPFFTEILLPEAPPASKVQQSDIASDRDSLPYITEILLPSDTANGGNSNRLNYTSSYNEEGLLLYDDYFSEPVDDETPVKDTQEAPISTSIGPEKDSGRIKATLEAFDKAIEMNGNGASSDSLQLQYHISNEGNRNCTHGVGCSGNEKVLKQRGARSGTTRPHIPWETFYITSSQR